MENKHVITIGSGKDGERLSRSDVDSTLALIMQRLKSLNEGGSLEFEVERL